jgi:hypothetical protein
VAYLGNDLQVAFPTYRNIDDISGSFNGVTTSFPLTVDGVAPIPAPVNSQQCLISVNGVVQRPDDSGAEGFLLSGGNIVFASAPAGGVDFFGVILAGADYINIGANFPSGTALVPSITFDSDLDTGIYNPAGNQIGFTTAGVQRLVINSSGQVSGGLGSATTPAFSFLSDPNTGIYSPGADQVAVATNGTGRLFVDASGLLVGTSSSVALDNPHKVQIAGSQRPLSMWVGTANSDGAYLSFGKSRNTTYGSYTAVQNGDELGAIAFLGDDGTDYATPGAYIQAFVDGNPGTNDMPGRLVFSTTADGASTPTERMRIASNGFFRASNLGSYNDPVNGNYHEFRSSVNSTIILRVEHTSNVSGNGTFSSVLGSNCDNTSSYHFTANNSYGAISDIKLKENIVDANSQWDDLKALQVRNYNFKEGQTHTQIGLVAQEVELVSPGLVTESPDRDEDGNDLGTVTKSVNYSVLYMKAVKALQEAMERIEQLEAKVAALESA